MAICPTMAKGDFLSRVIKPKLLQEKDLLFDYDNLRTCLDPTNEINEGEPADKAETKVTCVQIFEIIIIIMLM